MLARRDHELDASIHEQRALVRGVDEQVLRSESGSAQTPCEDAVGHHALKEPQDWLTYWGDYTAVRHRDLKQINLANVKDVRVEWMFQTGVPGGAFQTVPLVVDGIMYFTAGEGTAFALDARSGRQLWRYKHAFPAGRRVAGVNRGMAMLGNTLYMVTIDSHLVALDAPAGHRRSLAGRARQCAQQSSAPHSGRSRTRGSLSTSRPR